MWVFAQGFTGFAHVCMSNCTPNAFSCPTFFEKISRQLVSDSISFHRQGLASSQTETLSFCNDPGLRATNWRLFAQISEMFVAARPNSLQIFRDFPLTDDRILKHCQLRQRP